MKPYDYRSQGELVHILPAKVSVFTEALTWQFNCDYPFEKRKSLQLLLQREAYMPREPVYYKEVSCFQGRDKELENLLYCYPGLKITSGKTEKGWGRGRNERTSKHADKWIYIAMILWLLQFF